MLLQFHAIDLGEGRMLNTQERLLTIGENLLCERGYGSVSFGTIASKAGIRKASIHHHFPAKADFGLAVLDRYSDRLAITLGDIFATSRNGAQALGAAVNIYREGVAGGSRMCLCTAMAADSAIIGNDIREMLARANTMVADWIEQVLLTGRRDRSIAVSGNPDEEAASILAQLQGAQMLARATGDATVFDKAIAPLEARLHRH